MISNYELGARTSGSCLTNYIPCTNCRVTSSVSTVSNRHCAMIIGSQARNVQSDGDVALLRDRQQLSNGRREGSLVVDG